MKKDNLNYNPRLWTDSEKSIMRSYYGHIPVREVQLLLYKVKSDFPRTVKSIESMAYKLNLSKKTDILKWSQLELDYLKSNYQIMTFKQIGVNLNRTENSIQYAFKKYFPELKKLNFYDYTQIDNFLIENSDKSASSLSRFLKMDYRTVINRMKKLNIYTTKGKKIPYSDSDIKYLKDNYNLPNSFLSKKLNRSKDSIDSKLKQLGLLKFEALPTDWTDDEIKIIKDLFPTHTVKQISKLINRKFVQVQGIIRKLGISKRVKKDWTIKEDEILKDNYKKLSYGEIAKLLGRSYGSIKHRIYSLDLKKVK